MGDFIKSLTEWHRASCMIRHRLHGNLTLPFYVTNIPLLSKRREHTITQLKRIFVTDVTWVHCANGDEVASNRTKTLGIHPEIVTTRWTKNMTVLMPGTLSLAMKHLLAIYDASLRKLHHAAIVEDDITFETTMHQIQSFIAQTPADARVLHFASYSRRHHFNTIFPRVPHTQVYRRYNNSWIVGATGYVVFTQYANEFFRPIRAPADIQMFLQGAPIYAPQPTYGTAQFLGYPSSNLKGGTHNHITWQVTT